jgi:putative mycofactocin binding protein MftB
VSVVESLAGQPTAEDAVRAVGIPDHQRHRYQQALATLAELGMICPRETP